MGTLRSNVRSLHRDFDGIWGRYFCGSPFIKDLPDESLCKIAPENFHEYRYSKTPHFKNFRIMSIYERQTSATCDLKVYQDLLVYSYILNNLPKGSRILEVGGGNSRVIDCLKDDYEFWNLDRLQGQGHGPKSISENEGFRLVKDFIGAFSEHLPENYFDLIYSISVVEHFPSDKNMMTEIIKDFTRLLKNGAGCLHCVDALLFDDHLWIHPIINEIMSEVIGVIVETDFEKIRADEELWVLPNYAYFTRWFPFAKKRIREFGRPFSLNIFWQKFLR